MDRNKRTTPIKLRDDSIKRVSQFKLLLDAVLNFRFVGKKEKRDFSVRIKENEKERKKKERKEKRKRKENENERDC